MMSGCGSSGPVNALTLTPAAPVPTHTVMPLFRPTDGPMDATMIGVEPTPNPQSSAATLFRPAFDGPGTPTPDGPQLSPTVDIAVTPTAAPTKQATEYVEVAVYGDKVDPNWTLEHSSNVAIDPFDTSHWFSMLDDRLKLDSGAVSLAVTPLADFGTLFFTVGRDAGVTYDRQKVLGVSLWINSGSTILDTNDLVVAVVGSNDLSYWSADDYSVFPNSDNAFSETRLFYLGLNRAIPPDTWAQVIVWLDEREFDPLYSYVTGFYIKNDAGFNTTYYVDNISLLMLP